MWDNITSNIRIIGFTLDTTAIDALSSNLTDYTDVFSSKRDYEKCSLCLCDIKETPETQLIQFRPYQLNSVLSKQFDITIDSCIATGLIQHPTLCWSSSLACVPKQSGGIRIAVNYQTLGKVAEVSQLTIPRVDGVLDTLNGDSSFSVFYLSSGFIQLTIHSDTIPLTPFFNPSRHYEWP